MILDNKKAFKLNPTLKLLMKETRNETKAFERYKQIVDLLSEAEDKQGLTLVQELIEKCVNYVNKVVAMQKIRELRTHRAGAARDNIEETSPLDKARRLSHEALISQLRIVNRYLFQNYEAGTEVPIGGIYSLEPMTLAENTLDRNAIGDWSFHLANALFKRGIVRDLRTQE